MVQWQVIASFQGQAAREQGHSFVAMLMCPFEKCHAVILAGTDGDGNILDIMPNFTPPIDSMGVPVDVMAALQEAANCFGAKCYKAAAIMVRRTLEVVCSDKGATGKDLKLRLDALAGIVTMPKGLFDAMHNLRLMGNDAAHIESKTFEQVDKREIDIALRATREIVRAVYQYQDLTEELNSLKKAD